MPVSSSSPPGTDDACLLVGELDDGAAVEELALDRAPLERVPCLCFQPVEAGTKERVQARRQRVGVGVVLGQPRHELLGKERVAGGGLRDPFARRLRSTEALEQRSDLGLAERLEPHRHRPLRTSLEQLRPRQTAKQERCLADHAGKCVEEIEERRLGPVDVVDQHDERTLRRCRCQERRDRLRHLVRSRRPFAETEQLRKPRRNHRPVRLQSRARLVDRVLVADPGQLAHDLRDRPERDPLPVGKTRTAHHPRARPDLADELGREARLAHPRLTDDRHQTAAALGDGGVELALEQRELVLAPDQRAPRPRRRGAGHLHKPVRGKRLRLPLRRQRLHRLNRHRIAHEPIGRLADQHLARRAPPAPAARPRSRHPR